MGKHTVVGTLLGYGLMFAGVFTGQLWLAKAGYYLVVGSLLAGAATLLAPKPKAIRNSQTIEYFGTVEPRRLIYGEQKVSGMQVIPPYVNGGGGEYLHQILALCVGPVEEIGDIYFDKDVITWDEIDAPTDDVKSGMVNTGKYSGKAQIRRYTGTSTQTVDYVLYADSQNTAIWQPSFNWDSNHRGRGVAYLALTYHFDDKLYKQGKPEVACMVKGLKCYDPRLDSNEGANPTSTAYAAWTDNPALCLAHYLTSEYGLNEDPARLDWDLVAAAADICDETVTVPDGTQARYTCNVVLPIAASEDERRDNLETLAGAMMGHVVYRGGLWRMYAGGPAEPTFTITESDVIGRVSIRTELPSNEKYNYVRGQFVDAARNYQVSEFSPRGSTTYETADGERLPREVTFDCVDNEYEAQRNALVILRRSRMRRTATMQLGLSCYKLRPWDMVVVDLPQLGLDQQLMRCTAWTFAQNGTLEATFLEEDNTVWADPSIAAYSPYNLTVGPNPNQGFVPYAPSSFTATGISDAIVLAWTPDSRNYPSIQYRIYVGTASDGFASATLLRETFNAGETIAAADTTTRYYWVTAVDTISGQESDPSSATGVAGAAVAVTSGFRVALSHSSIMKTLYLTSAGTSVSVSSSISGGTSTFTYAWARVAGGSLSITANSSTSSATTFTCTGLADQETKSATFTLTVTDSASPQLTATASVLVSFYRNDYGAS